MSDKKATVKALIELLKQVPDDEIENLLKPVNTMVDDWCYDFSQLPANKNTKVLIAIIYQTGHKYVWASRIWRIMEDKSMKTAYDIYAWRPMPEPPSWNKDKPPHEQRD